MLKFFIYYWVKFKLNLGFFFFYREFTIVGAKNLPKGKPVLLLPNHQNAFMDALVCGAISNGRNHFMTRADVFSNPAFARLMSLVNMLPIYRIRDGVEALGKNEEVFRRCYEILNQGYYIMLHPEANHDPRYRLRPISKGFTRIVFGALDQNPGMDLQLVPMGINYSDHHKYRSRISVHFGTPVPARLYYNMENRAQALKQEVEESMKKLIVHIPHLDNYDEVKRELEAAHADFTDPVTTNSLIEDIEKGKSIPPQKEKHQTVSWAEKLVYPLVYANNILLILLWKNIGKKVKDPGFAVSIKFTLGIFILPLLYLLQTMIVYAVSGNPWIAFFYLFLSVFSVSILSIRQGGFWNRPK